MNPFSDMIDGNCFKQFRAGERSFQRSVLAGRRLSLGQWVFLKEPVPLLEHQTETVVGRVSAATPSLTRMLYITTQYR